MTNYQACLQALKLNTAKLNEKELALEKATIKVHKLQYGLRKEKKK